MITIAVVSSPHIPRGERLQVEEVAVRYMAQTSVTPPTIPAMLSSYGGCNDPESALLISFAISTLSWRRMQSISPNALGMSGGERVTKVLASAESYLRLFQYVARRQNLSMSSCAMV